MDGKSEYELAIKKYNELCEKRDNESFWSDNIIDSSTHIKTPIGWQNFYEFLSDKDHRYHETMLPTLGESIDNGTAVYPPSKIEFDYVTVKNGYVTHMQMTPRKPVLEEKTDEL